MDVLYNAPPIQATPDAPAPKANERPCELVLPILSCDSFWWSLIIGPVCRANISPDKLFSREPFEPTDKELNPNAQDDEDDEDIIMISDDEDETPIYNSKGKGKAVPKPMKSRLRARSAFVELDDDGNDVSVSGSDSDDDDDMSDFIVESDEDEEEKDARRLLKKRHGKKRINVILDSDDEPDTLEEKEVIFGVRKKVPISKEVMELMPRFLPSSKMKVCSSWKHVHIDSDCAVHDGWASQAPKN